MATSPASLRRRASSPGRGLGAQDRVGVRGDLRHGGPRLARRRRDDEGQDLAGAVLGLRLPEGVALLGAGKEHPVEERDVGACDGTGVHPTRQLAAGHPLLEQERAGHDQLLPAAAEHLPGRGLGVCLGPGLDEETGVAGGLVLGAVEVEADRDGQLLGDRRAGCEARCELAQTPPGGKVAGREEEIVLALEVGVDRTDGQAALADDVGDRRAVEAALAEDPERRGDDPLADLLLVGGAYARHVEPDSAAAPMAKPAAAPVAALVAAGASVTAPQPWPPLPPLPPPSYDGDGHPRNERRLEAGFRSYDRCWRTWLLHPSAPRLEEQPPEA